MRVMVLVKASESSEAGTLPDATLMAEMGAYNAQLVEAGIMRAGDGLKPSSMGYRICFSGSERTVVSGPFEATSELVAGYWLWEVDSMEQALDWAKRCPNPMPEDSEIEIRPFYEMADFAEVDADGEIAAQEDTHRETMAMQASTVQPYLFFGGKCEEALRFYEKALHARLGEVFRFSDSPDPAPEGMLADGFEEKIMHTEFTVGNLRIMASDGCDASSPFSGFRLTLTVANEGVAQRAFDALADGGVIDMPLQKTFWSPCYGMVTDPFGIGWMVMVPGEETAG